MDTEIVREEFKCPNPECDDVLQVESDFKILNDDFETKAQVRVCCHNCMSSYNVTFAFESIEPIVEEDYDEAIYEDWSDNEELDEDEY